MKAKSYPLIREMIQPQVWGRGLRRMQVSQLCERLEALPAYQREMANLEEHSPNARLLLQESLPRMVTEYLGSQKRPIYVPAHYQQGAKKSRILCRRRTYLAYKFYGAWYYQHFDGIGPEVAEMMLQNVRANRQAVQKQERILELAVRQIDERGCTGAEVDWDAAASILIEESPLIFS